MKSIARALVVIAALAAAALAFGFVMFATSIMRGPLGGGQSADGIVVLTGGDNRIVEGARLLKEGRGKRLLISGVNRITRREDVEAVTGLDHKAFTCCVDLGYEALDTVGNADEARTWANANGYQFTDRCHVKLSHAARAGRAVARNAGRRRSFRTPSRRAVSRIAAGGCTSAPRGCCCRNISSICLRPLDCPPSA